MSGTRGRHPGANGVDVDREMAASRRRDFTTFELLMHQAVATHHKVDWRARLNAPKGVEAEAAEKRRRRHEGWIRLLVAEQGGSVQDTTRLVEEQVNDLLAYRTAAVVEWRRVAEAAGTEPLTPSNIGYAATIYYDIVAYANALLLTMAEALAELKAMAEAEDATAAG